MEQEPSNTTGTPTYGFGTTPFYVIPSSAHYTMRIQNVGTGDPCAFLDLQGQHSGGGMTSLGFTNSFTQTGNFCDFDLFLTLGDEVEFLALGNTNGEPFGSGHPGMQLAGSPINSGIQFSGVDDQENPGGVAFQICDSGGCSGGFNPLGIPFYSQITNTPSGYSYLYAATSTSSTQLKELPNDWALYVSSTTDSTGNPIIADGYQWYQVTDPTDGVSGWMEGEDSSGTTQYLPFDSIQQTSLESTSTAQITVGTTTGETGSKVFEAIDHYYNDTSTSSSLYSSDDVAGYQISRLKTEGDGYPEKLVLGIVARESGNIAGTNGFDNENITSDFGHGIMQITFAHDDFDNRGLVSGVILPQCLSQSSSLYLNCYTAADPTSPFYRHYTDDSAVTGDPTFKQYTNTSQSIYSNIKDGMGLLSQKYNAYSYITASTTADDSITYSPDEIKDILATENYNGDDSACGYVDDVADKLDVIGDYFAAATTSDISDLVEKMHDAGQDMVCAQLHSPGDLSIEDGQGRVAGIVNGQGIDNFPLAVYDKERKFVHILASSKDDNYIYKVTGTANATYGLDITIKNGSEESIFHAKDIPITIGETHAYNVNKAALLAGANNAVTINIQAPGGRDKGTITVGAQLTGSEFSNAISLLQDSQIPVTSATDSNVTDSSVASTSLQDTVSTTTQDSASDDSMSTTTTSDL